jgi:hypothetical protein
MDEWNVNATPEDSAMRGKGNESQHHATGEKDFSSDETEFLVAMDAFKRTSGKNFPTLCDTLGVIRRLGYARQPRLLSMDDAMAS